MSYNIYRTPKTRYEAEQMMKTLQARELNKDQRELKKALRQCAKEPNRTLEIIQEYRQGQEGLDNA